MVWDVDHVVGGDRLGLSDVFPHKRMQQFQTVSGSVVIADNPAGGDANENGDDGAKHAVIHEAHSEEDLPPRLLGEDRWCALVDGFAERGERLKPRREGLICALLKRAFFG